MELSGGIKMQRLAGCIDEDFVHILWDGVSVGTLTQRINDACEMEYVFRVNWGVWDEIKPYQTITGINMDLRKEEYVRNFTPHFMIDYLPPKGREDIPELMERLGMQPGEYDMWEFMKASHRCCRDKFRVATEEEVKAGLGKQICSDIVY